MKNPSIHGHISGFDYLRAFMSVFVVVWHMGGAGKSLIFSKINYTQHTFTFSDLLNFHVLLLAVPTFIFISVFLYGLNGAGYDALRKRLKRIVILLTFWPIALVILINGYKGIFHLFPNSISSLIITILRAGNTEFYFFVCLILCLFIAYPFAKLKCRTQVYIFILSVFFLTCLPALTKVTGLYFLSAYWNPLNFVPISLLAILVSQNLDYIYSQKFFLLFASCILCVLFSIFEWRLFTGDIFFPGQGYAIPGYTRTSLLFGVFAIVVFALDPNIKSNFFINHMSKYSLFLYCIHPFFITVVAKSMFIYIQNEKIAKYLSIILVILCSYALGFVLKYYLKDEVLS